MIFSFRHVPIASMPLTSINHYLIRSNDIERSRAFYEDVLGMSQMPRPNFPFPGYWLGVGKEAQVHLAPSAVENASLYFIGSSENSAAADTGVIDHVAFLAKDPEQFIRHLESLAVSFRPRYLAESRLFQLFVRDPDGVMVELNFFGIEQDMAWVGEDYNAMPRVN